MVDCQEDPEEEAALDRDSDITAVGLKLGRFAFPCERRKDRTPLPNKKDEEFKLEAIGEDAVVIVTKDNL